MIATTLMVASAAILLALGTLHLVYTFVGDKLRPRDAALQVRMTQVAPGIARSASMWGFWMGFNVSHSMAAMLFGLVYGYLALVHPAVLFGSIYLRVVGFAMLGGLLATGLRYWFRAPVIGIALALACYVSSVVLAAV